MGSTELAAGYAVTQDPPHGEQLPAPSEVDRHQGTFDLDLRVFGGHTFGLALSLDTQLGFQVPGAFVWGVHLLPLGLGLHLGQRGHLIVTGGLGGSGITEHVPAAFELPVEATLELDLGPYVHLRASGRITWAPWADSRAVPDDLELPAGADQLDLRAGLAFGKRHGERWGEGMWSDGTGIGVSIRQRPGETLYGVYLSLAIVMGGGGRRR